MFTPRKISLDLMRQQANSNATRFSNNVNDDRNLSKEKDSDHGVPEQKELSNIHQTTSERRGSESLLDKVSTLEKEGNSNATCSDNNVNDDRIVSTHDKLTQDKSLIGGGNGGPGQKELSNIHQATSERRDREALLAKVSTPENELLDSQSNEKSNKSSDKTSKGKGADLYANLPPPKSSSGRANVSGDREAVMDELFEARKKREALLEKMSGLENKVGFSEEEVAADLATLSGPSSRGYCFCSKPWECERCGASIISLLERFPNSKSTYEELNKYATISKGMALARITSEKELLLKWRRLSHNLMAELKVKLYHIYGIEAPPAFQIESNGSFKL